MWNFQNLKFSKFGISARKWFDTVGILSVFLRPNFVTKTIVFNCFPLIFESEGPSWLLVMESIRSDMSVGPELAIATIPHVSRTIMP